MVFKEGVSLRMLHHKISQGVANVAYQSNTLDKSKVEKRRSPKGGGGREDPYHFDQTHYRLHSEDSMVAQPARNQQVRQLS